MATFDNLWETFPDENCVLTNRELLVEVRRNCLLHNRLRSIVYSVTPIKIVEFVDITYFSQNMNLYSSQAQFKVALQSELCFSCSSS